MSGNPTLVVTTANRVTPAVEERARAVAAELKAPFVPRSKRSLPELLREEAVEIVLVATEGDLFLHHASGIEYRYHPNLAVVRAANIERGGRDLYLSAAAFSPGESVLDCTLGFGSEAMLAALAVGETGVVTGLESAAALALVTREGMAGLATLRGPLSAAKERVRVVHADYRDYLAHARERSFDVVSFDPFFVSRLHGSEESVSPLVCFGDPSPLDPRAVERARRVARRLVLAKHPYYERLPGDLETVRSGVARSRKGTVVYSLFDPLMD